MPPSPEPSPLLNDILVDGFIAHTFSALDAEKYFEYLFQTQDFLRVYRISYSQGAWRVTPGQNAPFTRQPMSRSPIQDSPQLVDFDVRATEGTVVPQRRWTAASPAGYRLYLNKTLQLPIFFVHRNGGVGFSLSDILQGHDAGLCNGDKEASLGGATTIFIRISWPGYDEWRWQIKTHDATYVRNRITLARFMKAVGRGVDKFMNTPMVDGHVVDPRWGIGVHGITQNNVRIIGTVHVSPGGWMPIIQLTGYVF